MKTNKAVRQALSVQSASGNQLMWCCSLSVFLSVARDPACLLSVVHDPACLLSVVHDPACLLSAVPDPACLLSAVPDPACLSVCTSLSCLSVVLIWHLTDVIVCNQKTKI